MKSRRSKGHVTDNLCENLWKLSLHCSHWNFQTMLEDDCCFTRKFLLLFPGRKLLSSHRTSWTPIIDMSRRRQPFGAFLADWNGMCQGVLRRPWCSVAHEDVGSRLVLLLNSSKLLNIQRYLIMPHVLYLLKIHRNLFKIHRSLFEIERNELKISTILI